jgi:hypothetical protein
LRGRPLAPSFGRGPGRLESTARCQAFGQVPQAVERELPAVVGRREGNALRAIANERVTDDPEGGLVRDRHGAVGPCCQRQKDLIVIVDLETDAGLLAARPVGKCRALDLERVAALLLAAEERESRVLRIARLRAPRVSIDSCAAAPATPSSRAAARRMTLPGFMMVARYAAFRDDRNSPMRSSAFRMFSVELA